MYKLRRNGISGQLLLLVESFLANREQQTVFSGKLSKWGSITAGIPQGSIWGPLFFLIYINDLPDGLKCNVQLFTCDTFIFTVVQDPNAATDNINHNLQLISLWGFKWRMEFNPDPIKQAMEVTYSRKISPSDYPPISFNSVPVRKVMEHKHLGIILDSKLSFNSRINDVVSRCRQGIGLLKLLSKYLRRHTVNEIYKLYIQQHLDYGNVIYHIPGNIYEYSHIKWKNLSLGRILLP